MVKRGLIFLVCLAGVGLTVAKSQGLITFFSRGGSSTIGGEHISALRDEPSGVTHVNKHSSTTCFTADDIATALQKFSSESEEKIGEAQTMFLNKAKESQECRDQVIAALMKVMDQPDLDFTRDKDAYYLWRYGAEVLGELKASEALDLLISHLDLRKGTFFSTSMNHQPALGGVIKMGPIAIPKLDAVLRNNPDAGLRFDAVYCIATIGGPSAIDSLEKALNSESDECIRRSIRVSLDSFDDNGNITNRMKWFSGLLCDQ